MRIDWYGVDREPVQWNVTTANGETHEISGAELYTEGGALIIKGENGALVVAFGPGAWLEVQRS